eukprot:COSAG06_NODE_1727_length_8571_cov_31.340770_3_plen_117_part_00
MIMNNNNNNNYIIILMGSNNSTENKWKVSNNQFKCSNYKIFNSIINREDIRTNESMPHPMGYISPVSPHKTGATFLLPLAKRAVFQFGWMYIMYWITEIAHGICTWHRRIPQGEGF